MDRKETAVAENKPEIEQRPRAEGLQGLTISSQGHVWRLPSLATSDDFRAEREQIYQDIMYEGKVPTALVNQLAFCMLLLNYDQTGEEIQAIIEGADRQELVNSVVDNIISIDMSDERATYNYWVRTALIAGNLDPAKIRADDLPGVMAHLVQSGRVVHHSEFTGIGKFAKKKAELMGQF